MVMPHLFSTAVPNFLLHNGWPGVALGSWRRPTALCSHIRASQVLIRGILLQELANRAIYKCQISKGFYVLKLQFMQSRHGEQDVRNLKLVSAFLLQFAVGKIP